MLTTPVLFLVFNRAETTYKVFEKIRKVKPTKLFISADAPRANVKEDVAKCLQVREIINQIDWDCEVHTNFKCENMGCDKAIPSGIDWFFEHVDTGIILEDDCMANVSFFYFCQDLLERYKDDARIMHISGNNFLDGKKNGRCQLLFFKRTLDLGLGNLEACLETI